MMSPNRSIGRVQGASPITANQFGFCTYDPGPPGAACSEKLIHIDCLTESPKRQRDDRADLLRPDPVRLAPDIIQTVAERIDASQFNPRFPKVFPRFVQHTIWRYCAENGLDVCNGNQINDDNIYCRVYAGCDRVALRTNANS